MYLIDFCAIACKPQTPKQLFMNLTFTKMKALAAGALLLSHCTYAQINTPSGVTKPFATNTSYAYGIMPTNLPSGGTYGASGDAATASAIPTSVVITTTNDDNETFNTTLTITYDLADSSC